MLWLLVVLGCALGGVARHLIAEAVNRIFGKRFPWGTLAVNALGSLLLGLMMGTVASSPGDGLGGDAALAFAGIGFCGGLTTFSTFSLQSFALVSEQAWGRALLNLLGSVLLCLFCLLSGYGIGGGLAQ